VHGKALTCSRRAIFEDDFGGARGRPKANARGISDDHQHAVIVMVAGGWDAEINPDKGAVQAMVRRCGSSANPRTPLTF
jgi:hypothetical protein